MISNVDEPTFGAESFTCPHCKAVAHQDWYSLFLKPEKSADIVVVTPEAIAAGMLVQGERERDSINEIEQFVERLKRNELTYEYQTHSQTSKVKMANLHLSNCHSCNAFAVWVAGRLAFPIGVEEMPDLREEDFEEAAAVLNKFPRGAAALIRICIQNMMALLKESNLEENVSALVRKGLEVEIQQTMDVLQVLRNNPLNLTDFNSTEDKEVAIRFFDSLSEILKRRMLKKGSET